jgi:hypothetical protein
MQKLQVNLLNDIKEPANRKYTLTHSDETGMRYLFIDNQFAAEEYDALMDHVIAQWHYDHKYLLQVYCYLVCPASKYSVFERYHIFKRHMPRVIKVILFGDEQYIRANKSLLQADIEVFYMLDEDRIYIEEEYGSVSDILYNL